MLVRTFSRAVAALALLAGALAPASAAEADMATPPMWRVSAGDSEAVLLGTFHILPPGIEWRTPALASAFEAADAVYFEAEVDSRDAPSQTLNVLMTKGFNPPGVTLSSLLSASDAEKLRQITASVGLPFAAIDPMRPWQAFLTLSVQFIVKQGFTPGAGVDSALLSEARTFGKELRFFETIEGQLALFTGLEPETELALLELTIRDWDEQAQSFGRLFEAWRAGDAEFIDREMNGEMRAKAPAVFERLIVERNEAWAEIIARALRAGDDTLFVAVGAAHLAGMEDSVPALLAAKGFEVSRYGVSADAAPTPANDNAPEAGDDIGGLLEQLKESGRQ